MVPSRLILLDEPFEGLAPVMVEEVMDAVRRLSETVGMLLVEHKADLFFRSSIAPTSWSTEAWLIMARPPSCMETRKHKLVFWASAAKRRNRAAKGHLRL